MIEMKCPECGAELIPEAGFCRQCGAAVLAGAVDQPAAKLNDAGNNATTRRLAPRPTSPGHPAPAPVVATRAGNVRTKVTVAVLAVAAVFALRPAVRSLLKNNGSGSGSVNTATAVSRSLVYPGARIVLDISNDGPGSVLQLSTSDSLDKVQAWYMATLQPTKILQVTLGTVILRKDNVTATIAAENNVTNIVIKQSISR